ncbi:GNAT family N-acetyltransferase [Paenibacillus sp. y28]|uniref:GNAT family N-acetyltransferase n=1 Tax=Paenibacillus sp. y28 TaxID=3129110 RepID=UPI003018E5D6
MEIRTIACEQTWELRHQVMWPDRELDYVKLPDDPDGVHFGLYAGDVLVSVISLFRQDGAVQFRKFATLQREQGKGYGAKLLEYAMEQARSWGAELIWCNARTNKAGYYEKFGLAQTDIRSSKGGKDYVRMEMRFVR